MNIGWMITAVAGLSFLGLGVQPPTADWGTMIASGRQYISVAPHVATLPGLAIFFTVLGFNLLGDGLRDASWTPGSRSSRMRKNPPPASLPRMWESVRVEITRHNG